MTSSGEANDLLAFLDEVPSFLQHIHGHFSTNDSNLAETLSLRIKAYVQVSRAFLSRLEDEMLHSANTPSHQVLFLLSKDLSQVMNYLQRFAKTELSVPCINTVLVSSVQCSTQSQFSRKTKI